LVIEGFSVSFSSPVHIDGSVDGDSSKPEKNASIVLGERIDSLKSNSKGVFENIFGQLRYWKFGQNGAPVQAVRKPLKQDAGCGSVSGLQSLYDELLFLERGKIHRLMLCQRAPPVHPTP
jgi:hypothetical protein